MVVVAAVGLLAVGALLWFGRIGLRELAAANVATALAAALWLALATGFSRSGEAMLVATAAALVGLAAAEVATLSR